MDNIVLDRKKIEEAYRKASDDARKALAALFGKEVFDVRNRIKSYEDACGELGEPMREWDNMERDEIAYIKLKTIIRALNEEWEPYLEDESQYKYYVWIKLNRTGGVSYTYAHGDSSNTNASFGVRLALKNRELAIYCGEQFIDLWLEYLLLLEKK